MKYTPVKPVKKARPSKWDLKRKRRNIKRVLQKKKPLAEPLEIAFPEQRKKALSQGRMVFRSGEKIIELPFVIKHPLRGLCDLQGVYRTYNGRIIILRSNPVSALMLFFELKKVNGTYSEVILESEKASFPSYDAFAFRSGNLAHMDIKKDLRGQGLGIKTASKTEREQRAKRKGKHSFLVLSDSKVAGIFRKTGYKNDKRKLTAVIDFISGIFSQAAFGIGANTKRISKNGKFQPKDDLNKFHRIEAIDPKTGKARIFTFEIK